jgi:hypothetical protein
MANVKKKKVWLEFENSAGTIVEVEVEINDYDEANIVSYEKSGKLVFKEKKEKNIINLIV